MIKSPSLRTISPSCRLLRCCETTSSFSTISRAFIVPPRSPTVRLHKQLNVLAINKYIHRSSSSSTKSSSSSTKSSSSSPKSPKSSNPSIPISARISSAFSFLLASGLVIGGVGLTGIVIYYFVNDILLPTSDVQIFNKAFSIIGKDPQCQKLLGGNKIKAHGEETSSKWGNRNRPIASRRGLDGRGKEHVLMHFHVQGDIAQGIARLEMVESDEKSSMGIGKFDFRYLVVEVPGHPRVYLIDNSNKPRVKDPNTGFLGVRWGPKKDV